MTVVYRTSLKTTRMQAVRDDIDSGVGPGALEIGTTGFATTLVSIPLADPASTVSGDTLTFEGLPLSADATASGTAAEARVKEAGGTVIISGLTVGISGANLIIFPSATVTSGQPVQITSAAIQHG